MSDNDKNNNKNETTNEVLKQSTNLEMEDAADENVNKDTQEMNENIKNMITQFEQCASAAGMLSDSIENLAKIFTRIDASVDKLSQTEQKLRNNDAFNKLVSITESTKEMFNQLNKTLQISKWDIENQGKEVHVTLEEIKRVIASLNDNSGAGQNASESTNAVENNALTTTNNAESKSTEVDRKFESDFMEMLKSTIKQAVNEAVNEALK